MISFKEFVNRYFSDLQNSRNILESVGMETCWEDGDKNLFDYAIEGNYSGKQKEQISENFEGSVMEDDKGVKRSVEAVVKFAEKNKKKYLKQDFPISKLKHELKWWDKQNKADPKSSNTRMMKADTSYPLLVIKNKSYGLSVADGLNRLKKAIDVESKKGIDVYIVPEQDLPEDTKVD